MSFPGEVMVPLDGSSFGERALALAAGLARRSGGRLRLLTVHVPLMAMDPDGAYIAAAPALEQSARESAEAYLDEVRERIAEDQEVEVVTEVRVGAVEAAVLAAAEEHGVGMIVMSTHGRGGLRRLWLGSVADRVVRSGQCPVLLVPGPDDDDDAAAAAAPADECRTIIIPLDGSELAEAALAPATAVGELYSAEYILFRAVPPPLAIGSPYLQGSAVDDPALHERQRSEAKAYLDRVAADLARGGRSVTILLSEEPAVHDTVVRLADAEDAAILVMTTHGRGGVRRMILGSVADKVVRGTVRPVLLIRPETNGRGG